MQLAVEEANYLVHMKNEERVKSSMYIVQGYSLLFILFIYNGITF